ncbi:hypothetical protein C4K68_24390 [Pokkaliibacter plantistimulans]|uniref:Uncharacterized protein n=1 Tax=Proteobacteria bacterium 228 TaxID=2083153 RepID=A0A2S5KK34_9PROT|nr:hotdog fold domain-containing protein [Pokkaliibacter plantistimulans]PPC74706.1 hypothetical protein C4K68_24390 [Pokkaliibacter plantistimulans]
MSGVVTPEAPIIGRMNVRVGNEWTHYSGEMVAGAMMIQLWGDCVSEVGIRREGHGGFLVGATDLQFLHPVHTGDSLQIEVTLSKQGSRSRQFNCITYLELSRYNGMKKSEGWNRFEPSLKVAEGILTVVMPK